MIERGGDGRLIAGVEVGIADRTLHAVGVRPAGEPHELGERLVGDKNSGRPRDMVIRLRRCRGRSLRAFPGSEHANRHRPGVAVGKPYRKRIVRDDRVREVRVRSRIRVVGELLREHLGDEFHHLRRQLRGSEERDRALAADGRHRAGLVDVRDRRQRHAVEQHIRAGGAVRFDQHLEFDRRSKHAKPIRLNRLQRQIELDFHEARGAADAHGGDRGIDLHVAMLGGGTGDKGDSAGHQTHQR
ncbi:hypothetical protein ES703_109893 [subsurface metagenome]